MVDARRMEVFTAAYDFALGTVVEPGTMVVDENSFKHLLDSDRQLYFMGDGAEKIKSVINHPNALWLDGLFPQAKDMLALAERSFRNGDFLDVAYSVPNYLKAYQTTKPRNLLKTLK